VCQVHTAIGSLVRSWWLSGRASAALIEDTARIIQHWQQRIAAARKCHIKRTRKILREMGIYGIGGGLSRVLFDEDGTVPLRPDRVRQLFLRQPLSEPADPWSRPEPSPGPDGTPARGGQAPLGGPSNDKKGDAGLVGVPLCFCALWHRITGGAGGLC
jgi:hypothetical protein